nr:hypothetical protein Iba_chr03cCG11130 [Ipomoea batatas]
MNAIHGFVKKETPARQQGKLQITAWKKLTDGSNFAEPIIASLFSISADITSLKIICQKVNNLSIFTIFGFLNDAFPD